MSLPEKIPTLTELIKTKPFLDSCTRDEIFQYAFILGYKEAREDDVRVLANVVGTAGSREDH